jgi:hypothetical protein
MASTYVNDLRLNEMATGDASGSWGTVTNTNLELIGEAFSYGTETIGDADSTLTIADGAADAARSFYLKITSSVDLTTTRIVTLAPNTVSKVWMIENATTGSQVITIKQGSGATINVPNGQVKMISTDGAGSGGAVLDLLVDVDLTGTTTLVNLDVSGTLGVTGVLTATSLDISGDIDVDGTTNLDVVDIDGATQIDATVTVGVDDTGYDVKFFGATAGAYMLWDESADDLILGGAAGLSVNSTALVTGVLTTTAATVSNGGGQFNGAINVGVDDTGYDVKFFGATTGKSLLWDESADSLTVAGNLSVDGGTIKLDGNYPVGTGNVALGDNVFGFGNLSGSNNTAMGQAAMYDNSTGAWNLAAGYLALENNTTGSYNVALGASALGLNTTASSNTAVGYQSLYTNTAGENMAAFGYQALYSSNTTGSVNNNAFGFGSLYSTSTGTSNTSMGHLSMYSNTTGSSNVAMGTQALYSNTTASNNTAVGYQAGYSNTNGAITAIGQQALYSNTGPSNVAVGYQAAYSNTSGQDNVALGRNALYSNTTASNNTAVGYQAGYDNTTGANSVFIGHSAGENVTTGNAHVLIGQGTGSSITANSYNTFVGQGVGTSTTGGYNTFVGVSNGATGACGHLVTTGTKNTIIGAYSGNQGGLDIRTASNHIVLSDGDGNPRFYINNDAQSFSSASVADFIQKWSLGTTSTDGLIVTYPTETPNNTSRFFFRGSDSTNTKIDIYSSGTISNRTGTYNTLSDAKLKENIVDATPKLTKLMDVKVRNYNLIGDELKQIGFVAQELEQVFPNLIDNVPDFDENREPTGEVTKGVKLTVMIPILVKAIQEQQATITALTARITALEGN